MTLQILVSKSSQARKQNDIKILRRYINRIKYFIENEVDKLPDVQKFICRKFQYQSISPDQLIYKKGEPSLQFFLIFKGSVQIFMPIE